MSVELNEGDRSLLDRLSGAFLSRGPLRSAAETVAVAAVLGLGVSLSSGQQTSPLFLQMLVIGPLCAIVYAARTRLEPGHWRECVTAGAVVVLVSAIAASPAYTSVLPASMPELVFFTSFLFFWNLGAFAFFRMLAYLWPHWIRLRRSRLRWEMTHTTLMVVAAVSSVMILPFVLVFLGMGNIALVTGGATLPDRFTAILPIVGVLIFLTVVALAFVLPPAAVISYFAARNTASRLESLSRGTSGLREGNFAIRVQVDGEDEVSDVQKNFNLMAGNLERTVRDLRAERDSVERLLKTQRELVANVSHELRTPVATMRGYLDSALNDQVSREPQELKDDLRIMAREVVRLQRLIDDLFILSRAEAGQLPLDLRPTDIAALVSRCAAAVSESAWRTARVEVIEEVEPRLPLALADAGRLEQAVRNLLANAVRHTPPGGIVALTASAEPGSVVIHVQDTGEGIDAQSLDHIFERFYRLDNARQLDPSGAGLGLAIVKELTEAMGGHVCAESEPGAGSRFSLHIPQA